MLQIRKFTPPQQATKTGNTRPSYMGYSNLKEPVHSAPERGASLAADLTVHLPNGSIQRFKVYSPAILIGRTASADITIDNPAISRQHARITQVGNEYWIDDLGSSNGTMVNNARIDAARLQDGDQITLGAGADEPVYIQLRVISSQPKGVTAD